MAYTLLVNISYGPAVFHNVCKNGVFIVTLLSTLSDIIADMI